MSSVAVVDTVADLPGDATMGLSGQGLSAVHTVSQPDLETGIVLGCYDLCHVAATGLRRMGVSRVHAVLLRHGGEVWVVDAASTNGIKVDGKPCVASRLLAPVIIELGWETRVR